MVIDTGFQLPENVFQKNEYRALSWWVGTKTGSQVMTDFTSLCV